MAYRPVVHQAGDGAPGQVGPWVFFIGPRTPEHLESAVHAVGVTLDDKVLARLDEIFPGHKTAPEDYAW